MQDQARDRGGESAAAIVTASRRTGDGHGRGGGEALRGLGGIRHASCATRAAGERGTQKGILVRQHRSSGDEAVIEVDGDGSGVRGCRRGEKQSGTCEERQDAARGMFKRMFHYRNLF